MVLDLGKFTPKIVWRTKSPTQLRSVEISTSIEQTYYPVVMCREGVFDTWKFNIHLWNLKYHTVYGSYTTSYCMCFSCHKKRIMHPLTLDNTPQQSHEVSSIFHDGETWGPPCRRTRASWVHRTIGGSSLSWVHLRAQGVLQTGRRNASWGVLGMKIRMEKILYTNLFQLFAPFFKKKKGKEKKEPENILEIPSPSIS